MSAEPGPPEAPKRPGAARARGTSAREAFCALVGRRDRRVRRRSDRPRPWALSCCRRRRRTRRCRAGAAARRPGGRRQAGARSGERARRRPAKGARRPRRATRRDPRPRGRHQGDAGRDRRGGADSADAEETADRTPARSTRPGRARGARRAEAVAASARSYLSAVGGAFDADSISAGSRAGQERNLGAPGLLRRRLGS